MWFFEDQGMLLSIAHGILYNGHRPAIGPQVSVSDFVLSPLTYYLVAVFMMLSADPLHISLFYIVMNLLAGVFIYLYVYYLAGSIPALVAFGLFSLSHNMIIFGHTIWEPHPVVLFISLFMFFDLRSRQLKSWKLYAIGLVAYTISLALYPSGLLITAYVIWSFCSLSRQVSKVSRIYLFVTAGIIAFLNIFIFRQQLFQNIRLLAGSEHASLTFLSPVGFLKSVIAHVGLIVHDIIQPWFLFPPSESLQYFLSSVLGILFVGFYFFSVNRIRKRPASRLSVPILMLLLGLCVPAFFSGRMYGYRFSALYPYVFAGAAIVLYSWLSSRSFILMCTAIVYIGIFLFGNMQTWISSVGNFAPKQYPKMRAVAEFIEIDAARRGVSMDNLSVHVFKGDDIWDYFGSSLYYLLKLRGYPVRFTPEGNRLMHQPTQDQHVVYLLCLETPDTYATGCLTKYLEQNSKYAHERSVVIYNELPVHIFVRAEDR